MPELPEVETIRRGLGKFILHQKLVRTEILSPKSFIGTSVSGTVTGLRRFGKALVIDLDNDKSLMIHLRMTGQLIFDSSTPAAVTSPTQISAHRFAAGHPSDNFVAKLPNRQTRVILYFTHGTLYFNDQRKFGFIKPLPTSTIEDDPFIRKLAKDPWSMTPDEFYAKLQKHKLAPIKATILDQSIIAGLGNIYADESLFDAGVHPARKSGTLTPSEATRLLESARKVMDKSIESGGSTMATYLKPDGTKGDYLELFAQVFHRQNQSCHRCGTIIIKTKLAGRGTHLCPHCQLLERESND